MSARSQSVPPSSSTRGTTIPSSDAATSFLAVSPPAVAFPLSFLPANQIAPSRAECSEAPVTPSPPDLVMSTDDGAPTMPEQETGRLPATENDAILSSACDVSNAADLLPPGLVALQMRSPPLSPASSGQPSDSGDASADLAAVQDMSGGSHDSSPVSSRGRPSPHMRSLGVQTHVTVLKRGKCLNR